MPRANVFIESFNGRLRDECLSTSCFYDLADARAQIEAGRQDYQEARPHSELAGCTPGRFAGEFGLAIASTDR